MIESVRARFLTTARLPGWLAHRRAQGAALGAIAASLGAMAVLLTGSAGIAAWLAAVAGPLILAAALVGAVRWQRLRRRRVRVRDLAALFGNDPDPVWLTDATGAAIADNPAARALGADLTGALRAWCADPAAAVATLQRQAARFGLAERMLTRPGAAARLQLHQVAPAGDRPCLFWRLTRLPQPAQRGSLRPGHPMLGIDADGQVVRVNSALSQLLTGSDSDPDAAAALVAPLLPALAPVIEGRSDTAAVTLPDNSVSQAIALPAADGGQDIVLLPSALRIDGAGDQRDFEDVPVALALIDADGRILESNHLARALLGIAADETRHLWEVVEGLGRPIADWLADGRAGRALNRPEVVRATLPRSESFVQVILRRPPGAPPGPLDRMIAVLSDATEMKSLESRFVQSQKMQAIGQLAGGVAHDFNNLLTAISGHCDLLLLERDGFDPDFSDLQQIRQNTNRAAALVRQLLAFSRKQTLKPETVLLESLLENLAHLLTRLVGERIGLSLRHDPDLAPVRADPRQLEQVILNLVVNARDAMPMGGVIEIETEATELTRDLERGRARVPAGRYSVIRVSDAGLGIPAEHLDKIFEPFFTTKRPGEGTGLGLSTAYGIVKQMGGWIFADSREGSGSIFTLYFSALDDTAPRHDDPVLETVPGPRYGQTQGMAVQPSPAPKPAPAPAPAQPDDMRAATHAACDPADTPPAPAPATATGAPLSSPMPPPPGAEAGPGARAASPLGPLPMPDSVPAGDRGATPAAAAPALDAQRLQGLIVLLVEDEAPVRMFAARALRLQGCHVLEAENGEQALDFLADPDLRIDLFLTDVVMPGLDGPGWVIRALTQRPQTPVIFLSGYAEDALSAALARVPRSVFLGKPFSLHDLIDAVHAQTRRNPVLTG